MMRLDKYLAEMGVGTRQEVKKQIRQGKVTVNGTVVKAADTKIDETCDEVTIGGRNISYVSYEYYMLNKPGGVVSATEDRRDTTVIDLIKDKKRKDLFPVGRLDKDTEGLLLITNDGDLAHRLLAPKKHVDKVYYAKIDKKVTEEDIARIVAKWTNIPIQKLVSGEKEKLLNLEANLKKRVIGQDAAVSVVSDAIIRARSGIKDPIGSFIFMGPTGVGKTELAKALAYELFDDERHMVRIDCSEYMEAFNVSRLLGAPPGYVGYDEGGELTEAVRRNPYSIVLFDEIEKAHPDVFNILLQILDDGRITDSTGKLVDFKNTIIIMTSNLGSEYILDNEENSNSKVMEALKRTFRPEFINRIDEIVIFKSLGKDVVYNILDKIIHETEARLKNINLHLELTKKAQDYIIDHSYEESYGARPIKRYVTHNIETLIADKIVRDEIEYGATITVDVKDDKLVLN